MMIVVLAFSYVIQHRSPRAAIARGNKANQPTATATLRSCEGTRPAKCLRELGANARRRGMIFKSLFRLIHCFYLAR
jgi:hypothetical protein